jgi:hypothetical protein
MAYHAHVLVIASVTATSDDLLAALQARAERGPIDVTLLLPSSGPGLSGRETARAQCEAALAKWREAGLEADSIVGSSDPIEAVHEAWNPGRFDEIIVSTLPVHVSRWLRLDLPSKLRGLGLPVTEVTARGRSPVRA